MSTDQSFVSIWDALCELPNLAPLIKKNKIDDLPSDPLRYRHTLPWFLANFHRMEDKLRTIDEAIGILQRSRLQGVSSRLTQLARNDESWWGHLTETYLAAWLLQNGLSPSLGSAGPDFVIGDPQDPMVVEVTSLTRGNWVDRLFERLSVLADHFSLDIIMWYRLRRSLPSLPVQSQWDVMDAVIDAVREVDRPTITVRRMISLGPHEIIVDISAAKGEPRIYGLCPESEDFEPPSSRLNEVIERKAKKGQIPAGRSAYLVVDVSGIEGSHQWFIDEPDQLELDIPSAREHLRGIYLYWTSLDRIEPFACLKFRNARIAQDEPPVAARFDQVVCASRPSLNAGRQNAADTLRILDEFGPQPWAVQLPALVITERPSRGSTFTRRSHLQP